MSEKDKIIGILLVLYFICGIASGVLYSSGQDKRLGVEYKCPTELAK